MQEQVDEFGVGIKREKPSTSETLGKTAAELYAKFLELILSPLPETAQKHLLKANKELILALQSFIEARSSPDGKAREKKEFRIVEIE